MERGGRRWGSDDLVPVACRNSCLTTKKAERNWSRRPFLPYWASSKRLYPNELGSQLRRVAHATAIPKSHVFQDCTIFATLPAVPLLPCRMNPTHPSRAKAHAIDSIDSTRYHLTATILCCHPRLSSVEGSALNRRCESRRPPDRRCRQVRTQSQFEWVADSAIRLDGDWTTCACGSVGCTVCNPCRGGSESGCGRCKG